MFLTAFLHIATKNYAERKKISLRKISLEK